MKYPFTVKICEFNGGETVMPAQCIEALPKTPDKQSETPQAIHLILIHIDDSEPPHEITEGKVYIMNEAGKTVARYQIGE
ncbi:MAG: hypothetical protein Tp118SUR00d2C21406231_55 [Prokaryotic dsDNA virus sp.]|nr:MAG: hypothetical protein Tp125DCM00d2C40298531_74 [Prokaryotic dsDNA virus sp.]QDP53175.1 MAG: hypothetical protein Tp118SUR00d2C21406231_55 [Prokaryotic dsDNA virus sp.]|tara:strand:- start:29063 stop:29302 length:240 start_codon:yes stop_codon:yes gene_type:complete